MKQVRWIKRLLLFLIVFLCCTSSKAQINNLVGLWICEDDWEKGCNHYWMIERLQFDKDGKFKYAQGCKMIFNCENGVGAYLYAQKEGTYTVKDSTLVFSFSNLPITYDSGPIFTSNHGNFTRDFTLRNVINPAIEDFKKITTKWLDERSGKPWKPTIVMINSLEMIMEWDDVSDDGSVSQKSTTYKKAE